MERCEPDNPNRCQGRTAMGQCHCLSEPGQKTCKQHGGSRFARKETKRVYQLQQWNDRIANHAQHEGVKSLREEIGILRMCLEERLNACTSAADFMLHTGPIATLVDKIERTVTSCHKLEGSMGQLMDKQALIQFADTVISAVATIFPDATPEQMTRLGLHISQGVNNPTESEPEPPAAPLSGDAELSVEDGDEES